MCEACRNPRPYRVPGSTRSRPVSHKAGMRASHARSRTRQKRFTVRVRLVVHEATRSASLNLCKYIPVLYVHGKCPKGDLRWKSRDRAGDYIETRAVERAFNFCAREVAVAQRCIFVCALILDTVEVAVAGADETYGEFVSINSVQRIPRHVGGGG